MTRSNSAIELNNLRKEYGNLVAVDDVNLEVEEGLFFSLLGPSGSGKSTTLRLISGLEETTAGTVHLLGADVTDRQPQQRETNLVFQNHALFPHLNVEENIRFGLKYESLSTADQDDRIERMLELVDLPDYNDRAVGQLSGGEKQRVAMARSLAKEPDVLLLDEPLASLDRRLRKRMQEELKKIQDQTGVTFFYVTHDQETAMTLSDQMAIMNGGKIQQVGTPQNIYENPTNKFVADFIGEGNFVDGEVVRQNGTTEFIAGDLRIPLSGTDARGSQQLMIRPENILLSKTPLETTHTFTGSVCERVYQGDRIQYSVELDSGIELTIADKSPDITVGDEVTVGLEPEDFALV